MKRLAISLLDVAARENLLLAVHKAAKGKRTRPAVAQFLANLDKNLTQLTSDILAQAVPRGQFQRFIIHDPKRRTIAAPCFMDRVLHHACLNLAEPRFEQMAHDSSYACRPGKGVHAAVQRVQQHLRAFAYVVQVDVDGYFPSIDHARLKALLATRFKGKAFLALLGRLIDAGGIGGQGLPIGALTSQHFANAYLDAADRALAQAPRVRAHLRYMDDIIWWCDTLADAKASLREFTTFLQQHRGLQLKPNWHIGQSSAGVKYCGFRVRQGVILPSQRKMARYRQHAHLLECALQQGGAQACTGSAGMLSDAQLQRAASNAHAALSHCQSLHFRQRFWREQESVYDA